MAAKVLRRKRIAGRALAMRTLDMVTFLVLARNRHFGRTAQELHTTQPAISSRLALLEAEYGCRLVHRGDREFRLTPEGERALEVFQRVVEDLQDLKTELKEGYAGAVANVRIGAIDSVASTWMPHLIETLRDIAPNLRIELTVDGTKDLVHDMGKGRFDLIFCLDPAIGDGFRSFVACVWQMIWAGSPKLVDARATYSVDELARMPIITFPRDTPPYRQIAPYFQDERVLASKMTSSNSLFAIINLVIDGFGVAALPTVTIDRELDTGLLLSMNVSKWFPPMPIVATYQSSTHQKIIQLVADQALDSARAFCERAKPGSAWMI
jgi:DNA-binding transcriptional LysR family regulator